MSQEKTVFVGYIRVSTDKQGKDGDSLSQQEQLITEYCQRERIPLIYPICRDICSGTIDPEERPGIQKLRRELKDEATTVLCCTQDRLGRSFDTQVFMKKLEKEGVKVVFLDSLGIDTSTTAGKLLFTVKGALGEFEVNQLRDRIRANIAIKRRNHEQIGPIPFGSRVRLEDGRKILFPDPEQQETIQIIKDLRAQCTRSTRGKDKSMSYQKICNSLLELKRKNRDGTLAWYPSMIGSLLKR